MILLMLMSLFTACSNDTSDSAENDTTYSESTATYSESSYESEYYGEAPDVADGMTNYSDEDDTYGYQDLTFIDEDDLTDDESTFLKTANNYRAKKEEGALVFADELNACAKIMNEDFSKNTVAFAHGTMIDGSTCADVLNDAGIYYEQCDVLNGSTNEYNAKLIFNTIIWSASAYAKVTDPDWKYAGFYYDPDSLYWTVIFMTDIANETYAEADPLYQSEYNLSTFNNTTASDTFETYMRSLVEDDYETYLAITNQADNSTSEENFNDSKENYVGLSLSSIDYYQTELNLAFSGDVNYKVAEYTSDGRTFTDINTMGKAYGTVIINQKSDGTYYVATHYRYSPFFVIS